MDLIRVPKVENVKLIDRLNYANPDVGTLYLTPTHVIFVDPEAKKEYWILLTLVCSVEKLPTSVNGSPLRIKCKNFLYITFMIPKETDAVNVYLSICQLGQPTKASDLYCFFHNSQDEPYLKQDGWSKFSLDDHFKRFIGSNIDWVSTDLNKDYSMCSTYPSLLYVPKFASNECLLGSAKFRSKNRLPVLSYLYINGASVCRCSQPLSGFNNRSLEDELLLEHIRRANPNSKLYIVDTRPKINAIANRAAGKGYENDQFYSNAKFHFFAIENIHVMRASLNRLLDSCDVTLSVSNFFRNIESSHWLKHVKSLLETSNFIATSLSEGISVLVHCSDGWDRTAQACSLAALLLDPYYRTLDGFQALIHKEWLSFGYKFGDRCGHTLSDTRETAPVFTQFLDSVWQIQNQYPTEFEFNEDMLIVIHDHIYSCQFGTFVGNCERERIELELHKKTYSLWAHLDTHRYEYLNPFYDPICGKDYKATTDSISKSGEIMTPNSNLRSFELQSINGNTDSAEAAISNHSELKSSNIDSATTTAIKKGDENISAHSSDNEREISSSSSSSPRPPQSQLPSISDQSKSNQATCKKNLQRCYENFLKIDTSPQRIKFWRGLYNRHELLVHPRESVSNLLIIEKSEIKILDAQLQFKIEKN